MCDLLVKFTKIKYLDSIIRGTLRASFSSEFNDPFDAKVIFPDDISKILGLSCEQYIETYHSISRYHPNYYNLVRSYEYSTLLMETTGVYQEYKRTLIRLAEDIKAIIHSHQMICLSKCNPVSYQSLPMWGYYGDSGKGLCIGYKQSSFNSFDLGTLKEVVYKPSNYNIATLSMEIIKKASEKRSITEFEIDEFLSTKNDVWSHEREYRILVSKYKKRMSSQFSEVNNDVQKVYNAKFNEHSQYKVLDDDRFILMPVPEIIMLGWDFDYSVNNESLNDLQKYCRENGVKLQRLSKPSFNDFMFTTEDV